MRTICDHLALFTAPSGIAPHITGLYTSADIPAETFITFYTGEKQYFEHEEDASSQDVFSSHLNEYIQTKSGLTYNFNLHKNWQINAHSFGNLMRFANHTAHGFANCCVQTYLCSQTNTHFMGLYSSEDIEAGAELVFDYGLNTDSLEWLNQYNAKYLLQSEKS